MWLYSNADWWEEDFDLLIASFFGDDCVSKKLNVEKPINGDLHDILAIYFVVFLLT